MTERFNGLIVVLEKEMRDDDAESLMQAISHLRGVVSVSGNVANFDSHIAYQRARREIAEKLFSTINSEDKS